MTEFVQSFCFQVHLLRTTSPGPTAAPPPFLEGRRRPAAGRRFVRQPPTAPRVGAAGMAPVGTQSAGQQAGGAGAPPPDRLGDGGFAECQGLDLEADIMEYREGGSNDSVVRRAGRVKLQPIVLKRGLVVAGGGDGYVDVSLWRWLQDMVAGSVPTPRYDGVIQVLDPPNRHVVARWTFFRGLPSKVSGPQLNARTGEIALEELHIHHEGLRLEAAP